MESFIERCRKAARDILRPEDTRDCMLEFSAGACQASGPGKALAWALVAVGLGLALASLR